MATNSISNIRFFPRSGTSGVKASLVFTVGGLVEIKGAIMENAKGMWVSLPGKYYEGTDKNTQLKTKKWDAEVRAIDEEKAKELQETILTAYKNYKPVANSNTSVAKKTAASLTSEDRW